MPQEKIVQRNINSANKNKFKKRAHTEDALARVNSRFEREIIFLTAVLCTRKRSFRGPYVNTLASEMFPARISGTTKSR